MLEASRNKMLVLLCIEWFKSRYIYKQLLNITQNETQILTYSIKYVMTELTTGTYIIIIVHSIVYSLYKYLKKLKRVKVNIYN